MRRNLTAVLAADVAGYSRMMSEDAATTLATLRRLRSEILGPVVASRRGRVVKSMGDGWIVAFDAVVDAVECAMQAQDRLKIDGGMQMRVGIHIGDVVEDDGDVFGDGVNVAARLQEIAEPGSVAISDPVYSLLDGTLRPSFDDAGERTLKNIPRPVRVWSRGGEVAGASAAFEQKGFPRLAIQPVQTTEERAEVRELAAALTGDLMTLLDSSRALTARVSETPKAGEYVLRGNLRARGDRLRLEARLTAPDDATVIAEKIDGDLAESFDWQDAAARILTTRTFDAIVATELKAIADLSEDQMTVEQLRLLVGQDAEFSGPGRRKVLSRIVTIIEKAPKDPWGYAGGVANYFSSLTMGFGSFVEEYAPLIPGWMQKLDEMVPENSPFRVLLAFTKLLRTGDAEGALADIHKIVRSLPFDPEILFWLALLHMHRGVPGAALEALDKFDTTPNVYGYKAPAMYARAFLNLQQGYYEKALRLAEEAAEVAPLYPQPVRVKAAALAQLDRPQEAAAALVTLENLSPGDTVSLIRERGGFADTPAMQRYFNGLRKAGMPD